MTAKLIEVLVKAKERIKLVMNLNNKNDKQ